MAEEKNERTSLARKAAIATVCLLLLMIAAFVFWRMRLSTKVDWKMQHIREAGLPTSGSELNQWRPYPAREENGAAVLATGFSLMQPYPGKEKHFVKLPRLLETNYWSQEIQKEIGGFVEENRNAVQKIEEGLSYKSFSYVKDYSQGGNILLPHLANIRQAAHLFSAMARLRAIDNASAEAVAANITILDLARTLDAEPLIISWIVRAAVIQIGVETMERIFSQTRIPPEKLTQLDEAFAAVVATNLLPQALIGERALQLPVFRMTPGELQAQYFGSDDWPGRFGGSFRLGLMARLGVFEKDALHYMELMSNSIALAGSPQSLTLSNYTEKAIEDGRQNGAILTGLLMGSFGNASIKEARTIALVSMARTAIRLEQFRAAKGKLPEKLDELIPEFAEAVLIDPFDGKPIRYRPLDKGYLLYSVNVDGNDDAGAERDPSARARKDGTTYDLVFKVE